MKKLILAACVAGLGAPVFAQQAPAPMAQPPVTNNGFQAAGGAAAVTEQQAPAVQQVQPTVQVEQTTIQRPNVDYGMYGGPSSRSSSAPATRPRRAPLLGLEGPYKLYGVPDDLQIARDQQARIREAAVEFGRFRRQFTGSTQFWMDQHRIELAKSRYAMDEPMWRALHPPEYFGNGGYLYNTAESVGAEVIWGPPHPVLVQNPRPAGIESPVVNAPVVNTPSAEATPSSVTRPHAVPAPRVIAGSKPVYDAAASVGAPPSK